MEQDIKRLKEKINNIKKYDTYRYDWTETDVQTVEHLIKALKKRIEDLLSIEEHRKENYIPVSLVEETIEELIKEGRHYNANKIEVLQELLEKRK